jgi:protein-S-isoprenylcysteine O-methyltransferase Ste14
MHFVYRYLFAALWLSWAVYWWALSRDVKGTAQRESIQSRLVHIVPLAIAVLLLWAPTLRVPVLGERFIPLSAWPYWTGAAITAAGLLFAVWARRHIGANWSGIVTIKVGHELVTTGPYALVRHPIYTGVLLAFVGSTLARAEWRGILAIALATWALWRKLRIEERWLRGHFGEAYQEYSRRVAALVPFIL